MKQEEERTFCYSAWGRTLNTVAHFAEDVIVLA